MQAVMTPRLISTIDHSMIGCESVYVARADMVWMRMHWIMVTKNPRAKSRARATWQFLVSTFVCDRENNAYLSD